MATHKCLHSNYFTHTHMVKFGYIFYTFLQGCTCIRGDNNFFIKWPDKCQTNWPLSQTCLPANTFYLKLLDYILWCSGPTWFVELLATEHCCCITEYNSGENHSLLFNLDLIWQLSDQTRKWAAILLIDWNLGDSHLCMCINFSFNINPDTKSALNIYSLICI